MHDSTSSTGPQRPRVRRTLGAVALVAAIATPMAAASPASAAGGLGNVTPAGLTAVISQLGSFLAQIISGLPSQTLPNPLGEKAPNSGNTCTQGYADGLSSTLTCIISRLAPGNTQAKAKVNATVRKGKIASVRWVK
jgi:hypothetical protein